MEDPNKFDPNTQIKGKRKASYSNIVERREACSICKKIYASFRAGKYRVCKRTKACREQVREDKKTSININASNPYRGWYEHIGPNPIWCESKQDLYRACVKHGASARALMSGGEMKRPRGA